MGSAAHFIAESCAMFGGNLYASRASVGRILEGFGNGPETNSFEFGSFLASRPLRLFDILSQMWEPLLSIIPLVETIKSTPMKGI